MSILIKKSVILLAILIFNVSLFADNDHKSKTKTSSLLAFNSGSLSGYVAPVVSAMQIGDTGSRFIGYRGGLIIDYNTVIGLAGYRLSNPTKREEFANVDYIGDEPYIFLRYGGLLLEYHFFARSLLHFSLGTTIGKGRLDFLSEEEYNENNRRRLDGDSFFIVQPEIATYCNVTRFCRLGLVFSYMYVKGIDNNEFKDEDLRKMSGALFIAFGWF
ncbi:MAG: hypothetical protein SVZ03_03825 [Spirochaetota bacterium]|nr:hypothetical protein [Spirochaetota bacterium]